MRVWLKWLLGGVACLVITVGGVAIFFDWNWLRGAITEQASKRTGRTFEIGTLQGQWSLVPTITVSDVHIANAEWGTAPEFFSADLIKVTIDLRELLRGRTVLTEIRLTKPHVSLEVRPDGTPNWTFAPTAATEPLQPDDRSDVPLIGRLDIEDGRIRYSDPGHGLDLDGKLRTATASGGDGKSQLELAGAGSLQGQHFDVNLIGGSLLSLRENDEPYPVSIKISAVGSRAEIEGTLDDPVTLDGLDLRTHLTGPDLSRLTAISGVPLPITPSYDLRTRLERDGKVWSLTDIDGKMGHSDIKGSVKFDLGRERLFVEADLASRELDYRDVGFLIGVRPDDYGPAVGRGREEPAEPKSAAEENKARTRRADELEPRHVLPDAPLSKQQVRATDAKVKFRGEQVRAPNVPLTGVKLDLEMGNGVLHLNPLEVGIAGGTAIGDIKIDARHDTVVTDYDVKLRAFQLQEFLAKVGFEKAGKGRIDGRIRLAGVGDSVRTSLGHSDGDIRLVINHGTMSKLATEIVGLDVANALGLWATEDKDVDLRCFVADLGVRKGVATTQLFLLDTSNSTVQADGAADMRTELMDFSIVAHPKDASVLSLRSPITVKGPFSEPSVSINKAALAARGAAAAALGTLLTPLASILAFIDPGLEKDSDCAALVDRVLAPPREEAPGKIDAPR